MAIRAQLLTSARKLLARALGPQAGGFAANGSRPGSLLFQVCSPVGRGVLDGVQVEPSGRVWLSGWAPEVPALRLMLGATEIPPSWRYRLRRPDVAALHPELGAEAGYCIEFALPAGRTREIVILDGTAELLRLPVNAQVAADYGHLFREERVLHREHIYGYGPPSPSADPGMFELARALPAPILDLGCGSGAMVRALRKAGVEAFGIELRRPEIEASLRDDVRPFVTLYDGSAPLPYRTGQFAAVICIEVLEHIPGYAEVLPEMARVADSALITVPDMSTIPALFPHRVVPWHLLESTHVNFFTQASLARALDPHFPRVSFSRTGEFEVNGTRVFTSLVARCSKS